MKVNLGPADTGKTFEAQTNEMDSHISLRFVAGWRTSRYKAEWIWRNIVQTILTVQLTEDNILRKSTDSENKEKYMKSRDLDS
jgi:hypothetical protein